MLAAAVAALASAAPAAAEATSEIEVRPAVDFRIDQRVPDRCQAIVLAIWPDRKDAVAWRLVWKLDGSERSKRMAPPFDDERYVEKEGWRPPRGRHWVQVSWSEKGRTDGRPVSCHDLQERQKQSISDVRLLVTVRKAAKLAIRKTAFSRSGQAATLTLQPSVPGRISVRQKRASRRAPLLVASTSKRVTKAGRTRLGVRLNRAGKRALRAKGRVSVTVTLTLQPSSGSPVTRTKRLVFKAPKKRNDTGRGAR